MKKITLLFSLLVAIISVNAQAKTTEKLNTEFSDAKALYFYKNTLKMFNQTGNKDFDDVIKDIEKLKVLFIDKTSKFTAADYKKIKADYQEENYESLMTSRYMGKNFDIYFKDSRWSTPGTVILVNDSSYLVVLDLVGSVDASKVGALFSKISENSDIGNLLQRATNRKKEESKSNH